MHLQIFRVRGFTCKTHGFSFKKCCDLAQAVTGFPKLSHVVTVLRKSYPVFLPYNYKQAYVYLVTYGKLPRSFSVTFSNRDEVREDVAKSCSVLFHESERVEQFLLGMDDTQLQNVVHLIRARTNLHSLLGKSTIRSARYELFEKGLFVPGAGDLDRGAYHSSIQYNGEPRFSGSRR